MGSFLSHYLPSLLLSLKLRLKQLLSQKLMLTQVPGTDMDMVIQHTVGDIVHTAWDITDVDIMDMVDTHTLLLGGVDTTVARDLLMPNQKQKLPLIQVPGTDMVAMDMVATMAVATTEDTDIHTEDTTAEVTTGVKSRWLPNLHYHRKISNTAISAS